MISVTTSEWRGVSSAGPAAHFRGEAEEVSDDSFELGQPVIVPQRADCFVPFSFEFGEDYGALLEELGRVIGDAKNTLETTNYARIRHKRALRDRHGCTRTRRNHRSRQNENRRRVLTPRSAAGALSRRR